MQSPFINNGIIFFKTLYSQALDLHDLHKKFILFPSCDIVFRV